jgi:hypothetical protein
MDQKDDQPDTHAAARERRDAKRRRGMQVTGRSTKTVLPQIIARRGHEANQRLEGDVPPSAPRDDAPHD